MKDHDVLEDRQIIWTVEIEDLMKSWGEKAAGNRELHDQAAMHWKQFSDKLHLPLILLTTITGISNFGTMHIQSEYTAIATGSLSVISAFLAGFVKYYKPDEQSQKHISSAKQYACLYRQITLELGMHKIERKPANVFTNWAKQEYDKLQNEAPYISEKVLNSYKIKHKNDQNKPDIVADTHIIHIYGRNHHDLPT